jgi:hypothetical protein
MEIPRGTATVRVLAREMAKARVPARETAKAKERAMEKVTGTGMEMVRETAEVAVRTGRGPRSAAARRVDLGYWWVCAFRPAGSPRVPPRAVGTGTGRCLDSGRRLALPRA